MVNKIEKHTDKYPINKDVKILGQSIEVLKNGEFRQWGGYAYTYSFAELEELVFMTPEEFYKRYNKLCVKLYRYVCKISEERKSYSDDWHCQQCNIIKDNLEQIPVLKNSIKFDL